MKPQYFPQANTHLEKPKSMTTEECGNLYVRRENGQCISLWKASVWQRIKFLFHGRIWLSVVSGETQPPVWLSSDKNIFQDPNHKKFQISMPPPNRKRRRELKRLNKHLLN